MHELQGQRGHQHRHRHREAADAPGQAAAERRERAGQQALRAHRVRAQHDGRPQQVQGEPRGPVRLGLQQALELGFLLRVEQPRRRPHRPLLGHPDRVVGVEAVGRHRGGIDETARAGRGRGPEGVQRAGDVDRPDHLRRRGPGHQEGQVHHHVGTVERIPQRIGVADIPAPVLHLRPAVRGRIERAPGDAHDPGHPVVGHQQRHQAEPERAGRAGHRDRQVPLACGYQTGDPSLDPTAPAIMWSPCQTIEKKSQPRTPARAEGPRRPGRRTRASAGRRGLPCWS